MVYVYHTRMDVCSIPELQDTASYIGHSSDTHSNGAELLEEGDEPINAAQTRQKVTREEISRMKDTGVTAGELVSLSFFYFFRCNYNFKYDNEFK